MMKRFIYFFLLDVLLMGTGCGSVRKKFIREKKRRKESVVYVDFKEYSNVPPKESYSEYYLFAQGWLDEVLQALLITGNRKKQKQALREALTNIEQMSFFLDEEGKESLSSLHRELVDIQKKIAVSSMDKVKRDRVASKLEYIKRDFKRKFSTRNASQWMN